jgi:putative hydrolase of the HAD superfamily
VTIRAVFFDAGETIVHPYPSFPDLLTQVLRAHGHDVDAEDVRGRLHVISDRFLEASVEGNLWSTSPERSREFWASIYRTLLAEMGIPFGDGLATAIYRTFTDLSNYRLFPDVIRALDLLAGAGLTLGLISNFEAWLESLLVALGVAPYFAVRVISGVEGIEKPDPRIFELALELTKALPEESLYVGDNPVFDVEPAERVGMSAVLLDRRGRYPDHAGVRITTLDDLPAAIGLRQP